MYLSNFKKCYLVWRLRDLYTKQYDSINIRRLCCVSEQVDDIVTLIFQYINLLQKEGPQEWIFRECQVCLSSNAS